MEKTTPHCKLTVVKALTKARKVCAAHSGRFGATALGLDLSGMLACVDGSHASGILQKHDHPCRSHGMAGRVPPTHAGDVYLKLTVIGDVLIVSFKEL